MDLKWKLAQAAEIKWWHKYLKTKDKEDYYQWKRDYWNQFLANLKIDLSGDKKNILDAGCGPAGIFTVLQNHKVYGVDPLLDKYKTGLDHFDPSDYGHVQFVSSTLESYKPPIKFDIVFCLNCINHVKSIPGSLTNLFHMLEPGGEMILSIDAHNHEMLKYFFQIIPGDILHPHQFNIADYKQNVQNAGFHIRKSQMIKSERIFSYWVIHAYKPI